MERCDPKHNEQVMEPVTVCVVVRRAPFWQLGSTHEQLVAVEGGEAKMGLVVLL